MWFPPFPYNSYFLFPAGSADSSNLTAVQFWQLHISNQYHSHPRIPPPTLLLSVPQVPESNSFSPGNYKEEEAGTWDWNAVYPEHLKRQSQLQLSPVAMAQVTL